MQFIGIYIPITDHPYLSSSSCHWIHHIRVSSHFCTHCFLFVSSVGPATNWWRKLGSEVSCN